MSRDLYLILGVGESASVADIKRAYRKLARQHHPDINPGDRAAEELFKRISAAYQVLSDPDKRIFYDQNGYYTEGVLEVERESRWHFNFDGFTSDSSKGTGFGDFFGQFLRQPQTQREEGAGRDLECQISLSFEESIRGVETWISVYRKKSCERCEGLGRAFGTRDLRCRNCDGSGEVIKAKGHLRFSVTCSECAGSGRVAIACPTCSGDGRVARSDRILVNIPPGVSAGSRVRFSGKGNVGRAMESPGDLIVVTKVTSHPYFNRVGDNIHCMVPVTLTEAILGSKIQVPTIDGKSVLKIPPGTQSGQSLRMRGKGAPSLRGNGVRGDQYVEVMVRTPRIADERSKEILRELAQLNPDDPRKDLDRYGG